MSGPRTEAMQRTLERIAREFLHLDTLEPAELACMPYREHNPELIAEALKWAYVKGYEARAEEDGKL